MRTLLTDELMIDVRHLRSHQAPSVDTSNPATDRHRNTGYHAGELTLVIEAQ